MEDLTEWLNKIIPQKDCGVCGRNFERHRLKQIIQKDNCVISVGNETKESEYCLIICKFCEEDFFKESELIREQLISFPG
jgi:hypothetical protein